MTAKPKPVSKNGSGFLNMVEHGFNLKEMNQHATMPLNPDIKVRPRLLHSSTWHLIGKKQLPEKWPQLHLKFSIYFVN